MAGFDDTIAERKRWAAEEAEENRLSNLVFGRGTLANCEPKLEEFAVSPGWASVKVGCAWATVAMVIVGVGLWALVAMALVGGMR